MIEDRPADGTEGTVTTAERAAMQQALRLAAAGEFRRAGGNPRVGCVLLDDDGTVIGTGRHRGAGSPHAEVMALAAAGDRSRGATAVVTLEPCRHSGRTGPCTEALIAAGVRRVVFAQPDPNPTAAGGGDQLAASGIAVVGGLAADQATAVNGDWTFAQRHGRPRVRLKIAGSLDGRVAAADGSSRWITSAAARADGHRLRAVSDAVLAGTGTVRADDPQLTARPDGSAAPDQPLRAVFGTSPLPPDAAVLDDAALTVVLRTRSAGTALSELRGHGVSSVLVEGGPRVAAAFLAAGLVDEVISYVAPVVLGAGPPAIADLGINTIGAAIRGVITDVRSIGTGAELCVRITTRLTDPDAGTAGAGHGRTDQGGTHVHRDH